MHDTTQKSGPASPYTAASALLGLLFVVPAIFANPVFLCGLWPDLSPLPTSIAIPLWSLDVALLGISAVCIFQCRRVGSSRPFHFLTKGQPWIALALYSILGVISFLGATEVLFSWLYSHRPGPHGEKLDDVRNPGLYQTDYVLGRRNMEDQVTRNRCTNRLDGQVLFDKYYTTLDDGFRYVPQGDEVKAYHLACFGCSFMFGIGVDDAETLPAYLADGHPELHAYNFGCGSWGPGQTLLLLQQGAANVISERPGAAVYLLMNDHVNRIIPGMWLATNFTKGFPAFSVSPDGQAVYMGPFAEAYPGWMKTINFLKYEYYLRWSGLNLPPVPRRSDYDLCAAILSSARTEYRKYFPSNEFYVLLDPTCEINFDKSAIVEGLRIRGVPVLDAKGLFGPDPWTDHYPIDGHPKPIANRRLAQWFWEQFPNGLLAPPKS